MVRVCPVCSMSASFQYRVVSEVAPMAETQGAFAIGSITDNHKINQKNGMCAPLGRYNKMLQ